MGGLRTLGTALKGEKPCPLSLLWSFLPSLEGRALLCHVQHHEVGPSIGLKATGTTSHSQPKPCPMTVRIPQSQKVG